PPQPTLFPYTTLFRSRLVRAYPRSLAWPISHLSPIGRLAPIDHHEATETGPDELHGQRRNAHPPPRGLGTKAGMQVYVETQCRLDRKSTRLNSSHLGI